MARRDAHGSIAGPGGLAGRHGGAARGSEPARRLLPLYSSERQRKSAFSPPKLLRAPNSHWCLSPHRSGPHLPQLLGAVAQPLPPQPRLLMPAKWGWNTALPVGSLPSTSPRTSSRGTGPQQAWARATPLGTCRETAPSPPSEQRGQVSSLVSLFRDVVLSQGLPLHPGMGDPGGRKPRSGGCPQAQLCLLHGRPDASRRMI